MLVRVVILQARQGGHGSLGLLFLSLCLRRGPCSAHGGQPGSLGPAVSFIRYWAGHFPPHCTSLNVKAFLGRRAGQLCTQWAPGALACLGGFLEPGVGGARSPEPCTGDCSETGTRKSRLSAPELSLVVGSLSRVWASHPPCLREKCLGPLRC